ncbi:MAG: hypothetical protein IJ222_01900 [Bacteroidales bacterium]|nr:hypothetical protein [Bacteroidales bacterium]
MKRLGYLILVILLAAGCSRSKDVRLQSGDLIFVGIPQDYNLDRDSMADAIGDATGNGSLNLIHVAIAEVQGDSVWIIDATIKHGVDRHPLDTFLTDFTFKDGSYPVFIVKRLKDNSKAAQFAENTKRFLGRPYDLWFLPDNEAMYCSELVRESYRPSDDYLFENKPMNFRNSEGEFPIYWQQLFARLGEPIPQDAPGTNPQDMSASPLLRDAAVNLLTYSTLPENKSAK